MTGGDDRDESDRRESDRRGGESLAALLAESVVVCDGAMGTMLHSAGVPLASSLAELNVSRPELVRDLHSAYVAAGAHILQTNTFGANRLRLAGYGLEDSVAEINIAGARLAREAARSVERTVLVAGSVGPATSTSRIPERTRAGVLREQIAALSDWVDLLLLETFGDLASMVKAIEMAEVESDLPIVAQMTFGDDGRTLRGEDPAEVAAVLSALGVAAIGANCTVGPAALQGVVAELAASTSLPVSVQPNAGVPHRLGGQIRYARNAAYFGRAAVEFAESGAAIIGGCCGTAPAHVRAIAAAVADLRPVRHAVIDAGSARPVVMPAVVADPPSRWPPEGGFVVAVGLPAPRGHDVAAFVEQAVRLRAAGADLLSITDPAPPAARVNPIGAAVMLQERVGADVLVPMETADRNLATLQADLLGAHALGLRTVVCRTGAPRVAGDYPQPDAPWEVDSVRLISALSGLNEGVDWRGIATSERMEFVIGGAISPSVADVARELDRAQEKVAAGAHFLVTDVIWDVEDALRLLAALRARGVDVPVIASLAPFEQPRTLEGVSHEVPGLAIPSAALAAARSSGAAPHAALDAAVGSVEKLLEFVAGVIVAVPAAAMGPAVDLVDRLAGLRDER